MDCPSCGRKLDDTVNFCYYCGHSFRKNINTAEIAETAVRYDMKKAEEMRREDAGTPMKTWQWVLYFSTLLIPYLWIVWFVITCVWAVGNRGSDERRAIARALLISVIVVVIVLVAYMSIMINNFGVDGTISRLTGGVYNSLGDYMNSMGVYDFIFFGA